MKKSLPPWNGLKRSGVLSVERNTQLKTPQQGGLWDVWTLLSFFGCERSPSVAR